jgi:protein-L-isoaspartate(D-aspartate) O-methyltransferase
VTEAFVTDELARARQYYAAEVCFVTRVGDKRIAAAFATVPRELFLGRGPWRVLGGGGRRYYGYWSTPSDDPRHLYHDVLVALDEPHRVNNGQPSLYAALLSELTLAEGERVAHVGAGTGYYSALLAELVGPTGHVTAYELNREFAAVAREALKPWPQVEVVEANALERTLAPADAILASAGLSFPPVQWLEALKPGGRLLLPLTTQEGSGKMLLAIRPRRERSSFVANLTIPIGFIDCVGSRDAIAEEKLAEAFARGDPGNVKSLRLDRHVEDESCWLHADGWCLSRREPG